MTRSWHSCCYGNRLSWSGDLWILFFCQGLVSSVEPIPSYWWKTQKNGRNWFLPQKLHFCNKIIVIRLNLKNTAVWGFHDFFIGFSKNFGHNKYCVLWCFSTQTSIQMCWVHMMMSWHGATFCITGPLSEESIGGWSFDFLLLLSAWTNCWTNNWVAGYVRPQDTHVMSF